MNDCVFCKIVSGEISSEILFENEHVVSILDINPIHFGHALILPRAHYRDFLDLEPGCYASLLGAARVVSAALVKSLKLEGFNIFSNNGLVAGQSIFHFHLHVTPRYRDDDIRFVLRLKKYENGAIREYAERIKQCIKPQ